MYPTPLCLCFLTRASAQSGAEVLLGMKKLGFGAGKIVGLGGHVEPGESPSQAAAREVMEESSILVDPSALQHLGEVTFRFPARPSWDSVVSVFSADRFSGHAQESDEIAPQWFPLEDLPFSSMWDDSRLWLLRLLSGDRMRTEITYGDDSETVARALIGETQLRQPSFLITYGPGEAMISDVGTVQAWRWTALARFGPHFPAKFLARTLSCPWQDIAALDGDFDAPTRTVFAQIPLEYHQEYLDAVALLEREASAMFASMRAEFDRIKDIGDRDAFALAAQQIPDTAVRQAMFLLRDGQDLKAELRAWAAVRPATIGLFRTRAA